MQKFNNKLLLMAAALATSFASNATDRSEPSVVNMDTTICARQTLFGEEFNTAGTFQVTKSGFDETGNQVDTIWNIEVAEIIATIRAQEILNDNKKEIQLNVNIKANGLDQTPNLDYHWEPEIPGNPLNPIVSPTETATYTLYVDWNRFGDLNINENGCHIKESITIYADSAVEDIPANPSSKDNSYYNVNGQKVVSPEIGKVYINNRKKIMYK